LKKSPNYRGGITEARLQATRDMREFNKTKTYRKGGGYIDVYSPLGYINFTKEETLLNKKLGL
jgi:hypothetical protein